MANKHKGHVAIEACGETFTLSFSINALCELEEKLDLPVAEIAKTLGAGVRLTFLRTVFWAGLQDHHPGLDEKKVGAILTDVGLTNLPPLLTEAFRWAFPDAPGEGDAEEEAATGAEDPQKPKAAAPGTGKGS